MCHPVPALHTSGYSGPTSVPACRTVAGTVLSSLSLLSLLSLPLPPPPRPSDAAGSRPVRPYPLCPTVDPQHHGGLLIRSLRPSLAFLLSEYGVRVHGLCGIVISRSCNFDNMAQSGSRVFLCYLFGQFLVRQNACYLSVNGEKLCNDSLLPFKMGPFVVVL